MLVDGVLGLGYRVEALLEGIEVPIEHIRDRRRFIDWATYHRLFENAHALVGDDGIRELAAAAFSRPPWSWTRRAVRMVFTPVEFWSFGARRVLPRMYPCLELSTERSSRDELVMDIRGRGGRAGSRPLAVAFEGQMREIGVMYGYPSVATSVVEGPDGWTVKASYPPRRGGWRRWLGALRARHLGDAPDVFHAQEKLLAQLRELEAEVREREAAQEAYVREVEAREALALQVQKMRRLESIGLLAGGIAHDFNNILVVMLGTTELMLLNPDLPASLHSEVRALMSQAMRAGELTKQLLTIGRRQVVQPMNVDLDDAIERFRVVLDKLIPESIELEVIPAAEPLHVWIDPGQLEQVLMNLCVNARDAIATTGRVVLKTEAVTLDAAFVARHRWSREGSYAVLTISDDGEGIPAEVVNMIFDPFFTTKQEGRGTGLGLSVVLGIVEQHEGFVHVSSEPGAGTQISLYLPRTEAIASHVVETPSDAVERGGTESILLVEDEVPVREIARKVLSQAGYRVTIATDGRQAARLFGDAPEDYDLIVLDVVLPGMTGPEVEIDARRRRPDVPVLFTSGYSPRGVRGGLVLDADVDYLAKPYGPRELLSRVRRSLDASHRGGAPSRVAR